MRIEKRLWKFNLKTALSHLKIGMLMGTQMSVMCIGQLIMQGAVNSLGTVAIAGYTAASKVDQLGVLVDNAFISAIAAYISQNYGARKLDRVRDGIRASLILVGATTIIMILIIVLLMPYIVNIFICLNNRLLWRLCRISQWQQNLKTQTANPLMGKAP